MKRFTRYLRSRWIYLPTLAKVFLGASIVLTVVSTVISPVFWWSILDALLITVLVAEVNYLYLRRVFERPAIMFAEKVSRIMLDHDEIIIYQSDGEYRFVGITNNEEEQKCH